MRSFRAWCVLVLCLVASIVEARELTASRAVTLNARTPILQSPTVSLDVLTSNLTVKLQRPTSTNGLDWPANATIRVSLVILVDGQEYRCTGQTSGGIRTGPDGNELSEYVLSYSPPVILGEKAREYLKTATKDADGYYNDVPLTRLGETGSTVEGYLLIERVRGNIDTVVTVAGTVEAPAPKIRYHNSVAFDAATSAREASGDGVVSVSHTSSGSDRGVFASQGAVTFDGNLTSSSLSYGGAGMAEQWDLQDTGNFIGTSGYTLAGQSTGAQTVTGTLGSSAPYEQGLGIISMTGVDQSTPIGTPNTASGFSGTASVTVASVGSDDLVVDGVIWNGVIPTVGANQTQRFDTSAGDFLQHYGSTQSGADGGVMSWTAFSSAWLIGAVAFKPVAAASCVPRLSLLGAGC